MNRNALPFDKNGPWYTSGLRLGTAALTTLGMKEKEMEEIANIIVTVLKEVKPKLDSNGSQSKAKYDLDESVIKNARERVNALLSKFKLYPQLELK